MSIVNNKKAFFDYSVEDQIEAGIMLEGWEVKAIRSQRISLQEAYVIYKDGAFYLFGAHISPLPTVRYGEHADPIRTRKLLMNRKEIDKWRGKVAIAGYTVVPVDLHYNKGRIKVQIGLAKGKKLHDKRASEKEKDGKRTIERVMRGHQDV